MLNSIISAAVAKLEAHGVSHVYSAFDAVPVELKNRGIYQYFSEKIAPAAAEFSGLGSFLKRVSIKFDSNINRLVLTAIVSAVGTTKIERSAAAQ